MNLIPWLLSDYSGDKVGEANKGAATITTAELEAELEMDLDNLKLDDIDTTDVNLDDEDLLED